jgi:uncharacterized protein YndB with AHSA1/START domain
MGDKERGYAHRVDILADPAQVWQAFTDVTQLRQWCAPDAQIRARPNGSFRARVDRVTEFEAHIDVFEPARRLRLIYLPSSGLPKSESVIIDDFILEPVQGGTIVRLLGSGVPTAPQWDTQYKRLRASWSAAMNRLKILVEQHTKNGTAS